jgi:hypothetical protein
MELMARLGKLVSGNSARWMVTAGITAGVSLAIGLYAFHGGRGFGGFGGFDPSQFAATAATTINKAVAPAIAAVH